MCIIKERNELPSSEDKTGQLLSSRCAKRMAKR